MKAQSLYDWRARVKERDNYTCRDCGKRGTVKYLKDTMEVYYTSVVAHHEIPVWINKGLELEITNGVTLCRECHKKRHRLDSLMHQIVFVLDLNQQATLCKWMNEFMADHKVEEKPKSPEQVRLDGLRAKLKEIGK